MQWACDQLVADGSPVPPVTAESSLPPPTPLPWRLSPSLLRTLRQARIAHEKYADSKDYKVAAWTEFGLTFLKEVRPYFRCPY